jgi:hypothetical protein
MASLVAALIGAVVGLCGVAAGVVLQGKNEQRRWVRDHKLRAAVDFIGATGRIYDRRRRLQSAGPVPADQTDDWRRAQDARSALYLLCESGTVDVAEALISRVRRVEPATNVGVRAHEPLRGFVADTHDEPTLDLLRDLVRRLRAELGAGATDRLLRLSFRQAPIPQSRDPVGPS